MVTRSKDIMLQDDIDISALLSLEDQKDCCEKMLDSILDTEDILHNRMLSIQTINDAVQSDDRLINSLGEFLGFHYGRMSSSRNMINIAIVNLNRFIDGGLDEIDHGARGMYLNVWYNLGVAGLTDLDECLEGLEKMEADIIETAVESGSGVIIKETVH